jgi:hypothetical protein
MTISQATCSHMHNHVSHITGTNGSRFIHTEPHHTLRLENNQQHTHTGCDQIRKANTLLRCITLSMLFATMRNRPPEYRVLMRHSRKQCHHMQSSTHDQTHSNLIQTHVSLIIRRSANTYSDRHIHTKLLHGGAKKAMPPGRIRSAISRACKNPLANTQRQHAVT